MHTPPKRRKPKPANNADAISMWFRLELLQSDSGVGGIKSERQLTRCPILDPRILMLAITCHLYLP